jgi:hypothetical protein
VLVSRAILLPENSGDRTACHCNENSDLRISRISTSLGALEALVSEAVVQFYSQACLDGVQAELFQTTAEFLFYRFFQTSFATYANWRKSYGFFPIEITQDLISSRSAHFAAYGISVHSDESRKRLMESAWHAALKYAAGCTRLVGVVQTRGVAAIVADLDACVRYATSSGWSWIPIPAHPVITGGQRWRIPATFLSSWWEHAEIQRCCRPIVDNVGVYASVALKGMFADGSERVIEVAFSRSEVTRRWLLVNVSYDLDDPVKSGLEY